MSKNKYVYRSRLSEEEFKKLITFFVLDKDAVSIANALGLSRNTVNDYLKRIRRRIADQSIRLSLELQTLGERFFLLRKAGRKHEPVGPVVMYGAIQRNRTVFVDVHKEQLREAVRTIVNGKMYIQGALEPSVGETFCTYLDLDFGEDGVLEPMQGFTRQQHSPSEDLHKFLLFTRGRIQKLRGIRTEAFPLHLKECEFRFNYGINCYSVLMKMFHENRLE